MNPLGFGLNEQSGKQRLFLKAGDGHPFATSSRAFWSRVSRSQHYALRKGAPRRIARRLLVTFGRAKVT